MEDLVGTFPVLQSRIRSLETRICPQMLAMIRGLEQDVQELQRAAGLEQGFSLKARRAFQPDAEAGLAAMPQALDTGSAEDDCLLQDLAPGATDEITLEAIAEPSNNNSGRDHLASGTTTPMDASALDAQIDMLRLQMTSFMDSAELHFQSHDTQINDALVTFHDLTAHLQTLAGDAHASPAEQPWDGARQ